MRNDLGRGLGSNYSEHRSEHFQTAQETHELDRILTYHDGARFGVAHILIPVRLSRIMRDRHKTIKTFFHRPMNLKGNPLRSKRVWRHRQQEPFGLFETAPDRALPL